MPARRKYPPDLIERGVQMVLERRRNGPGRSSIMREVGEILGIHPEVLRHWVNKAETEADRQPTTILNDDRIRRLEEENANLRRINGILKAAAVLFASEIEPGAPF
ncbi:transposase [Kitasatospora sp. NPDC005856]|uniref:transposase n=1 Tax=Kitasatospora sp. NPDC005856 TaxID=3154566 RepID=UPI003401C40F